MELYRTTRSVNVWGCKTRLIDFLKRLFAFYDQNSIRRVLRPQKSTSRVLQPKKSTSRVLRSKYRSVAFYGIARRIEFRIAKRDQSTRPVDFWGRKMRQINSESPVRFYEARNRLVAFYDPEIDSSRSTVKRDRSISRLQSATSRFLGRINFRIFWSRLRPEIRFDAFYEPRNRLVAFYGIARRIELRIANVTSQRDQSISGVA